MSAYEMKDDIEACLRLRSEYSDPFGGHPFKVPTVSLQVREDTLVWNLWGGNLVFYDIHKGHGKFYFEDTSGG